MKNYTNYNINESHETNDIIDNHMDYDSNEMQYTDTECGCCELQEYEEAQYPEEENIEYTDEYRQEENAG
jgi:hypothetical protein